MIQILSLRTRSLLALAGGIFLEWNERNFSVFKFFFSHRQLLPDSLSALIHSERLHCWWSDKSPILCFARVANQPTYCFVRWSPFQCVRNSSRLFSVRVCRPFQNPILRNETSFTNGPVIIRWSRVTNEIRPSGRIEHMVLPVLDQFLDLTLISCAGFDSLYRDDV